MLSRLQLLMDSCRNTHLIGMTNPMLKRFVLPSSFSVSLTLDNNTRLLLTLLYNMRLLLHHFQLTDFGGKQEHVSYSDNESVQRLYVRIVLLHEV